MVKTLHARAATREEDFDDNDGGGEPNMKLSHAFVVVLLLHILAVGGVFAFNSLKSRNISPDRAKAAPAAAAAKTSSPDVVTAGPAQAAAGSPSVPSTATGKAPAKSGAAEAVGATYTVVAGDTLTRIASAQKTTVEAVEQANGIESNTAIRVGQVLKIPSKAAPAPAKIVPRQEPVVAKTADVKPAPVVAKAAEAKPAPVIAKTTEPAKVVPAVKTGETPAKPAAATAAKEEPKAAASEKTYTVAKGDNPYSIAKKLKVSYNELMKANAIADPTKLQIGQKLMVP